MVPTHDRAGLVGRAVASVLAQGGSEIEVVVVDDGSSDTTPGVLAALDDPRVRATRLDPARGGTAARNAGAALAQGEVLAFLDDDDELEPGWLAELRPAIERDPGVAVVCCGATHRRPGGEFVRAIDVRPLGPAFDDAVGWFDTGTYIVRRSAFDAVGGFVDGLGCSPHTELALRLMERAAIEEWTVAAVHRPLVIIHQRDAAERSRNEPERLYRGTTYILEHHRERLARDPAMLADYLAVAAVSAMRLRRRGEARRLFRHAVRARPGRARHWLRLALAYVPVVRDRVWRTGRHAPATG